MPQLGGTGARVQVRVDDAALLSDLLMFPSRAVGGDKTLRSDGTMASPKRSISFALWYCHAVHMPGR